jgi:hypothetical protein
MASCRAFSARRYRRTTPALSRAFGMADLRKRDRRNRPKKTRAVSHASSPTWKEALDAYFEAFLALLFPEVHALIDWSRGYESLDKELQQVVRELGRRYVDKPVKVWTIDGDERWVLIHELMPGT